MAVEEGAGGDALRSRFGLQPPFGQLLFAWLVTCAFLLSGLTYAIRIRFESSDAQLVLREDFLVVGLDLAIVALLGVLPAALLAHAAWRKPVAKAVIFGLAALTLIAGAAGEFVVFGNYNLSLDEYLARFDAEIFAAGRLVAPVPAEWRDYAFPLQPLYTLPSPDHSYWVSAYLPVNAALRALGRLVHSEWLVNPLLSAVSILACWGVGRRLWPERTNLALIAAGLLGTSSQLIVTGMTAYAMPAHLAFNLVWLWLFLRGGRLGHAGALAVGFLACGIHQLVFHPMFVAPFVLQLWLDRRWTLALLYTAAYAAFGLFWIEYYPIALAVSGVTATAAKGTGGAWLGVRIAAFLAKISISNLGMMALSLIRFVTWQNPLTAPLAGIGALAAWRAKGHLRSLLLGLLITLAAVLILVPGQTHGWGYRYLHGLLGSICLIAAWTWARLTDPLPPEQRRAATGALVVAGALSLFALTPLRAWQAWSYVQPYARANAAIQSANADVVVVDNDDQLFFDPGTVTRNDPFLVHRPKVMALAAMEPPTARELCASGRTIAVFNGKDAQRFGMEVTPLKAAPATAQLRALLAQLHCGRPL